MSIGEAKPNAPPVVTPGLRLTAGEAVAEPIPLTVVLMAGGFSPPPLAEATGRSPLDLPVGPDLRLWEHWQALLGDLSGPVRCRDVLCLCGGLTPTPRSTAGAWRLVTDATDYRGPAGALRDALDEGGGESLVLVAEASRLCGVDVASLLSSHIEREAMITVGALPNAAPAGLYVVQREALAQVPAKGFMDLKEQWLNRLVQQGAPVYVHTFESGYCPAMRTLREYLDAVISRLPGASSDPSRPTLAPRVIESPGAVSSIVCSGAEVHPEAIVVDSVLMPGSRVGRRATVVRSLVCDGFAVEAGETVLDAVLGPGAAADIDAASSRKGRP